MSEIAFYEKEPHPLYTQKPYECIIMVFTVTYTYKVVEAAGVVPERRQKH